MTYMTANVYSRLENIKKKINPKNSVELLIS
jgi:hypothetical protein